MTEEEQLLIPDEAQPADPTWQDVQANMHAWPRPLQVHAARALDQ